MARTIKVQDGMDFGLKFFREETAKYRKRHEKRAADKVLASVLQDERLEVIDPLNSLNLFEKQR